MSDSSAVEQTQNLVLSEKEKNAKNHAIVGYVMMLIGLVTGIFWLVGAVWAMVKKADAAGTPFEDHYSNIITTFWWSLGLSIIGGILTMVGIGVFIIIGVMIWAIYRIIKGLARVTSDKSYAD